MLLLSSAVDDDDLLLGLLVLRPSISNLLQSVSSVIIKCDGLLLKSATAFLFESATILLQSASIITKCDRTSWEFLEFGISRHPARRDQWRRYWLPTWLSRVFYKGYTTNLPSKTDHPPLPTNSTSLKEEHVHRCSILQETLKKWKCIVTLSLNRRNGSS